MMQSSESTNGSSFQPRWPFLAGLVALAVVLRLLPYVLYQCGVDLEASIFAITLNETEVAYPWNFSPMWAICLFGAAVFADVRLAFVVPMVIWLIGDIGIVAITGEVTNMFHPTMPAVYAGYLLTTAIGLALRRRPGVFAALAAGVAATVVFYLFTNFFMWLTQPLYPQPMPVYPRTWDGLLLCYELALPFLRNSLVSTAIFVPLLFSSLARFEVQPVWSTRATS